MFGYIKYKIRKLFDFIEEAKGTRTLSYVKTYRPSDAHYRIETNGGFDITIYCIEHIYHCFYSNDYFKPKRLSVFHVYSVCGREAPDALRFRLDKELKISPIASFWASREYHKKAAIQAYVDLVINDLHNFQHSVA